MPPPSPRSRPTRPGTACRPTCGSGSTSKTSSPDRPVADNFARRLEATARRIPDTPAFAGTLAARGVKPGDRIALTIGNHWAFAVALLAGWKLGATVAPLDALLKDDERSAILADLAPAAVVGEADVAGKGQPAAHSARSSELLGGASSAALILYTSGSTGRPKGALLSHTALELAIESWAGPVMALTRDDVVLATLPLAHSFGLNGALLAPLLVGATVALLDRFAPDRVVEAIRRHRITVFPGVATMFRRLLDAPELG